MKEWKTKLKKKKIGGESLSFYSSPVEKSPWSQLYEAHKKTWKSILADAGGTGVWGLYLLGLIDRGKERGCKAVGKVLHFGSVLISLLLYFTSLKGQQGGVTVKGKTQQWRALPAGWSHEAPGDILEHISQMEQQAPASVFWKQQKQGFPFFVF